MLYFQYKEANILNAKYKKDFLPTQELEDFIMKQPEPVQVQYAKIIRITQKLIKKVEEDLR